MASIPVTLVGSAYLTIPGVNPLSPVPLTIVADMSYTGLSVGGGPMPGGPPLGFWGGTAPPFVDIGGPAPQPKPEHPIVLPPDLPPTLPPPDERPIEWKVAWTPTTGWIVVGVPTGAHPTPSSAPST